MGSPVRISVGLNAVKADIERLCNVKIGSLANEPQLKNEIAELYGQQMSKFVPFSDKPPANHHLAYFTVTDSRVRYSRYNGNGDQIAGLIYDGTRGGKPMQFHVNYVGHQPRAEWDEAVRPGTVEWDNFIQKVKPIILAAIQDKIDG